MLARSITLCAMLFATGAAHAAPGDTFCRQAENNINTLLDWARTTCIETAGKRAGRRSFLLIADKPMFADPRRRKGFLLVACAAAGLQMTKQGLTVDELWFSDLEHTRKEIAFVVNAQLCKQLQAQMQSGRIAVDDAYAQLSNQLDERSVSKTGK